MRLSLFCFVFSGLKVSFGVLSTFYKVPLWWQTVVVRLKVTSYIFFPIPPFQVFHKS